MTDTAANLTQRRGACPGLSVPMPSGDGLLARLRPTGTISLAAFAGLCTAASEFGSGVVEITSRGSIQIRGLNAASAPRFANAVAALAIAADEGIPIHTSPLAGIDADEILDTISIAGVLRLSLARLSLAARLSPKVSVVVDGGGALGLDNLVADIHLRAAATNDAAEFRVSVGGDAATATNVGIVASTDSVAVARRLLEVIAQYGRAARARDVLATAGIAPFEAALAHLVVAHDASGCESTRPITEPIGPHLLRDGSFAFGLELAFGHADAKTLVHLAQTAEALCATGIRVVPGRAMLIIGLTERTTPSFAAEGAKLGFVVRANDPRRRVVACAGAPICGSAHIAARALAPAIAAATENLPDDHFRIHISGCSKGCARAGASSVSIVGRTDGCAIVANGTTRDTPFTLAPTNELPAVIADLMRKTRREIRHV